jgi:hypothetical protein
MKLRYFLGLFMALTIVLGACKKTPEYVPTPHACECGNLVWNGKDYPLLDAEHIRSHPDTAYSRRYYITANVALEGEEQTHSVNTWIEIPNVTMNTNGLYVIDVNSGDIEFSAHVDEFNLNDPFVALRKYGVRQGVVRVTPAPMFGGSENVSFQFILGELNNAGNPVGPDVQYSGSFTVSASGI